MLRIFLSHLVATNAVIFAVLVDVATSTDQIAVASYLTTIVLMVCCQMVKLIQIALLGHEVAAILAEADASSGFRLSSYREVVS